MTQFSSSVHLVIDIWNEFLVDSWTGVFLRIELKKLLEAK